MRKILGQNKLVLIATNLTFPIIFTALSLHRLLQLAVRVSTTIIIDRVQHIHPAVPKERLVGDRRVSSSGLLFAPFIHQMGVPARHDAIGNLLAAIKPQRANDQR